MRSKFIFILTHFYPVFIALHLYFGDNTRASRILLAIVPLFIFGAVFMLLISGPVKISKREKFNVRYLVSNMVFIGCYYTLCLFSLPAWAYARNYQAEAFILITLTFYCLNHDFRRFILRHDYD